MTKAVRILMWIHFVYLLLLPTLAIVSAIALFPDGDEWAQVLILGFPAVVTYCLFLANGYAIPNSLPIALTQVFLVPLQIGLGVYFFGNGSIWLFFAESAAIEISSFVLGIVIASLPSLREKQSGASFLLVLLLIGPCFIGGSIPHIALVFSGYGGASLWLLVFATAFATAFYDHYQSCRKVVEKYNKTKKATQHYDLIYDGGLLFKLLRIKSNVQMISPLWNGKDRSSLNSRVHVFGWTAILLPIVAGMIASIVF